MTSSKRLAPVLLLACFVFAASAATLDGAKSSGRNLLQDSAVYPRYGIHEIDAMDDSDPYKIMQLLAWQEMTNSEDRRSVLSYWRLAGIHGKTWPYNGVTAPTEGFCRHRQPAFGPWHRSYMKQYENALITAARAVVERFSGDLKEQYAAVAETIRLPFWDWTRSDLPTILSAARVTVIDEEGNETRIRNPFSGYQYTATAGTQRSAGGRVRRGRSWDAIMSSSASTFGRQMASFVRSNNWRCTYTSSSTCFGNLEGVHNDIHNILGGTAGDMATIEYAGFDPVFWLHHCMLDRALWLFQNNGGQWNGRSSYSPFQTIGGDVAQIASLGYTYSEGSSSSFGQDRPRRRRASRIHMHGEPVDSLSLNETDTAGVTVGSVAAKAAVKRALEQWSGNYTGYTWSVRLQDLNENQMDKPVHVYVLLKGPSAVIEAMPSKVEDLNDIRLKPNYCGSASGFNDQMALQHAHDGSHVVSRAVDLTECLQKAGINPAVAPAQPSDPTRGPSKVPVRLSDLHLVAIASDGEDVSSRYSFGKPVISWTLPVMRTLGQVRDVSSKDPVEAEALAAPTAFDAQHEVFSLVSGDV